MTESGAIMPTAPSVSSLPAATTTDRRGLAATDKAAQGGFSKMFEALQKEVDTSGASADDSDEKPDEWSDPKPVPIVPCRCRCKSTYPSSSQQRFHLDLMGSTDYLTSSEPASEP